MAFDSAGHIIVADCLNHRVLRYSDGSHVQTIGSEGSGNGQFKFPCSVAVDCSGHVFVHDGEYNGRIQVFRLSDGAHVRSMCSQGSAGHIIVADSGNDRVQVLRYSDGSHVRTIGSYGSENGQFNASS